MFKSTFCRKPVSSDSADEAIPYRLTILGLIGGIFLLAFLNHLMGMSFVFALTFVLHPIGYTMFSSWATFQLWFSIFLGWIIKYSILRYGGLRVYRQARPVFVGLIFGEMACAGIWMAIGIITSVNTGYRILWF